MVGRRAGAGRRARACTASAAARRRCEPMAAAFAAAGFAVERAAACRATAPTVADLPPTGWDDWAAAAEAALWPASARPGDRSSSSGQSMGGVAGRCGWRRATPSWPGSCASTPPVLPQPRRGRSTWSTRCWRRARSVVPAGAARHRRPRRPSIVAYEETPLRAVARRCTTALGALRPRLGRGAGARARGREPPGPRRRPGRARTSWPASVGGPGRAARASSAATTWPRSTSTRRCCASGPSPSRLDVVRPLARAAAVSVAPWLSPAPCSPRSPARRRAPSTSAASSCACTG